MAIHVELRTIDDMELDEGDELRRQIDRLYGDTVVDGSPRDVTSFDFVYSDFPKGFIESFLDEHLSGEAIGLFCEFEPVESDFEYIYPVTHLISRISERMPDVAALARETDGLNRIYARVEAQEWDMRHAFAGCILDLCLRPSPGRPIFCIRW
jgi:hypothetical protein